MHIGIWIQRGSVEGYREELEAAAEAGFPTAWTPQIFGPDALTMIAAVAQAVPEIKVGTAVVPIWLRHPLMFATQALTVQEIIGDRLRLGIGLTHQIVVEGMYGMPFERPAQLMQEYLSVLNPLLEDKSVAFAGDRYRVTASVAVQAPAPEVLVAALGPVMLGIAGRLSRGTVTWMTGPNTIRDHVAPTIRSAAAEAGRPDPEIIAGLPVGVTDDVTGVREQCAKEFASYGMLPSYRAMLDKEGAQAPEDVAIIGDEDTVAKALEDLFEAGATEYVAVPIAGESRDRTMRLLRDLL